MNGVWVKIMKFPNTPLSWTRVSPTKGHSTKTVNNAENPIQGYFQVNTLLKRTEDQTVYSKMLASALQ